jgi:hypothetical protein
VNQTKDGLDSTKNVVASRNDDVFSAVDDAFRPAGDVLLVSRARTNFLACPSQGDDLVPLTL